MKFSQPSNPSVVILLFVWILTNVFHGTGYAWCLGNDGHTKRDMAIAADCSAPPEKTSVSGGHRRSCLDLYLVDKEATLAKRLGKSPREDASTRTHGLGLSSVLRHVLRQPLTLQVPRLSPVILAHRTVVLLN